MGKSLRIGTALTALSMVGMLSACSTTGSSFAKRSSIFGDKVDKSNIGLATRAQAALEKGDVNTAIDYAERAVDNTNNDAGFRALLGNAYFAGGRFASAETAYRDSLALLPNQPGVILKLALVSIAQGKNGQAMSLLETSRQVLDASDYGLALALAGQPDRAVAELDALARQPGAGATIRQNLALAHALSGDWEMARAVASQDLAANMVDARIQQWMQFATPNSAADQVAALTGVTPAQVDPGQPVRLALKTDNDRFAAIMPRDGASAPAPAISAVSSFAPPAEAANTIADFGTAEEAPVEVQEPVQFASAEPLPPVIPAEIMSVAAPVAIVPAEAETDDELAPAPAVSAKQPVEKKMASAPARLAAKAGKSDSVVQLGAFSSRENVARAWKKFSSKYASLDGFKPKTTTIKVNGKTLYRLSVAGFDNRGEAKGFCSSLRTNGGACFVRNGAGDQTIRFASLGN